jgi:acetoin utilization protein AcuB
MTQTQYVMSKRPITIHFNDTMRSAWALMQEQGFRHLPVVDESHKVTGILSDRDVQRAMSVIRTGPLSQEVELDPTLLVKDFMSWPVYAVSETTSIEKVVEQMLDRKVSAFLVEDLYRHVKGIITTDDILKLFLDEGIKGKALKSITQYFVGPEAY